MDPNAIVFKPEKIEPSKVIKTEFIMVVVSNTVYLVMILKSLSRLKATKDWHFLFLLTAASFAFMNNTNDIYFRIVAPISGTFNCETYFLKIFIFSATLNWVPISYYQVTRLYRICINYYKRNWYYGIVILSSALSILYSVMYFLNLSEFTSNKSSFEGCVVSNNAKYTRFVELTDILDTAFSLMVVIVTLFVSLNNLKRYKLRHLRIKSILDENFILFFILVLAKIVLYTIIEKRAKQPGGDIWWDGLSVIVLICCYRLLNLKPRLNEKLEETNNKNKKNLFNDLSDLDINNPSKNLKSNKNKKNFYRNSKGELNFPSLMKKENTYDIHQNRFIFDSPYQFNNYNINNFNNNHFNEFNIKQFNNQHDFQQNYINPNDLMFPGSPTSSNNALSPISPHTLSPLSPHKSTSPLTSNQRKKNKTANINMNPNFGMSSNIDDDFDTNLSSYSSYNNKHYMNSSYGMSMSNSFNSSAYNNKF